MAFLLLRSQPLFAVLAFVHTPKICTICSTMGYHLTNHLCVLPLSILNFSLMQQPCCDLNARAAPKDNDWGEFCMVAEVSGCYEQGERAEGEVNFPAVLYKPCCDPAASLVVVDGDWDKFCESPGTTVTISPPATGKQELGERCRTAGLCEPGLFCNTVNCGKGGCSYERTPPLQEGEVCTRGPRSDRLRTLVRVS